MLSPRSSLNLSPNLPSRTLPSPRRISRNALAVMVACLVVATAAAAVLQRSLGVPDASVVYLLAVVAVGTASGTWAAVGTSIAAFLTYDFLFVPPYYTLSVAVPEEWLNLLLFLVVAIVIGRLTALQLERTREAERRAAESRALFAISRDLATVNGALEAAPVVTARLAREAEMSRVWLGLGPSPGEERVVADTEPGVARPSTGMRWVLRTAPSESQPGWLRVHDPAPRSRQEREDGGVNLYRVPIEAGGGAVGSLWATRPRGGDQPGRSATRLMAAAGDQLGQAVRRDRLAAEATAAEVARESDALKTALLDSVSHDLRTPLAAIRAAAGTLLDSGAALSKDQERELAESIDGEAERLNRLVRNLLDLSRIEGGALHPAVALYELADLVEPVVDRLASVLAASEVVIDVPADLPPLSVDGLYLEQILTNLLENAARYAHGREIRVTARCESAGSNVALTVEDGGPGVPVAAMERIFDKFYRVSRQAADRGGSRAGMGVGLAVVRGLVGSMGGSVEARPSVLGGLAIVLRLPAAAPAAEPAVEPARDQAPRHEAPSSAAAIRTEAQAEAAAQVEAAQEEAAQNDPLPDGQLDQSPAQAQAKR